MYFWNLILYIFVHFYIPFFVHSYFIINNAKLNCQRIYLRIMYKNKWIDEKKFKVAISKISEIGKIVGGLIKYYAKNNI